MLAHECTILTMLQDWLLERAVWRGGEYIWWVQPEERVLHVYSPMWIVDFEGLRVMKAAFKQADRVCTLCAPHF